MRTFSRLMRALALGAGLGLAAIAAVAAPAAAAVVVYSTSFEQSEGYVLGDLNGQQGWFADSYPGDCLVTSGDATQGNASVVVYADGQFTGDWNPGAGRYLTDVTATNPLVTISQDVKITSLDEADYLLAAINSSGNITGAVRFSYDGKILANNDVNTGATWTPGAWKNVTMVLDFAQETSDVFYGGTQIADDVPLANSGGLDAYGIWTDDYLIHGSALYYDNLSITATPEPATLGLLALGAAACWVRRRRRI